MIILIIGLVLTVGGALANKALWNKQTRLCTEVAYISSFFLRNCITGMFFTLLISIKSRNRSEDLRGQIKKRVYC